MSNELIPADPLRCQAYVTPAHGPFRLGPKPRPERCTSSPTFIVTEAEPGADGQKGSMSVCSACYVELQRQVEAGRAPKVTIATV